MAESAESWRLWGSLYTNMQADLDGFLVGGASLKGAEFGEIVRAADVKISDDNANFLRKEVALLTGELHASRCQLRQHAHHQMQHRHHHNTSPPASFKE